MLLPFCTSHLIAAHTMCGQLQARRMRRSSSRPRRATMARSLTRGRHLGMQARCVRDKCLCVCVCTHACVRVRVCVLTSFACMRVRAHACALVRSSPCQHRAACTPTWPCQAHLRCSHKRCTPPHTHAPTPFRWGPSAACCMASRACGRARGGGEGERSSLPPLGGQPGQGQSSSRPVGAGRAPYRRSCMHAQAGCAS